MKEIEDIISEFDKRFPAGKKGCDKGWGCDHCGACYNSAVEIDDVKEFLREYGN